MKMLKKNLLLKPQLIRTNGRTEDFLPANGKSFSLKELQNVVGGLIQIIPLPSGNSLVCNDEGKLMGLPENEEASRLWQREYPIDRYPNNNDGLVVGDVIVSAPKYLR